VAEPTADQAEEDRPLAAGGLIGPPGDAPLWAVDRGCTFMMSSGALPHAADVPRLEIKIGLSGAPVDRAAIRQLLQLAFGRRAD
jgi:hypothetical protein